MNDKERDELIRATHDATVRIEERCKGCHENLHDIQDTLYALPTGLKHRVTVLETMGQVKHESWAWWKSLAAAGLGGLVVALCRRR